jgi:hypothetical protein
LLAARSEAAPGIAGRPSYLHAYLVIDRTLLLIDRVAANCCT